MALPVKRRFAIAVVLTVLQLAHSAWASALEGCRNAEFLISLEPSLVIAACKRLADRGSADAEYTLGVIYNQGLGVSQDYAAAAKWYRQAAEQGNPRAQNNLGALYSNGQRVPQRYGEAAKWYRKAAEQGHIIAAVNLGYMYESGRGVAQDYAQAVRWYRVAAETGYPPAQFNVGLAYGKGLSVPKDSAKAAEWFERAADQGLPQAQMQLAQMLATGEGVPKNKVQAYMWLTVVVRTSFVSDIRASVEATQLRGQLEKTMTVDQIREGERRAASWKPTGASTTGSSVAATSSSTSTTPQQSSSNADAVVALRKLADEGDDDAQYRLGLRYAHGQGVQQDEVQADMWFSLAAARGNAMAATYRDDLERHMTPSQIAESKKRASVWKPSTP